MKNYYLIVLLAVVLSGFALAQTDDLSAVVKVPPLWNEFAEDIAGLQNDVDNLTPVAGVTYDDDTDFTDGAATVADNVAYVYVHITDSAAENVLTLPTGAENLGKDLILYVNNTYDGGSLDVVMAPGVTAEDVENGKYHFNCIDTATWTEVGDCKAIQELLFTGMPAAKDAAWVAANATFTIPDKQAGLIIVSTNDTATHNTGLILPTGAECVGDLCTISVACGGTHADTVDIYLGTINGTLEDVDNGTYLFACMAEGQWARLPVGQSNALTDWGPGTAITGDLSAEGEGDALDEIKGILADVLGALENAGIIANNTTGP